MTPNLTKPLEEYYLSTSLPGKVRYGNVMHAEAHYFEI